MKYPELKEPCKSCLGCMRLEQVNFRGDKNCKWQEKREWKQEKMKYETSND